MNGTICRLEQELVNALEGLTPEETQAGPVRKWTIQQIVEHLLLTYSLTDDLLKQRLEKSRPTRAQASFLQRGTVFLITRIGYFPGGRQAPEAVTPKSDSTPLSGQELARQVTSKLTSMNDRIEQAAYLFGNRSKAASHIVLGPLTATEWRAFHLAHGSHHARQIRSIRRTLPMRNLNPPEAGLLRQ